MEPNPLGQLLRLVGAIADNPNFLVTKLPSGMFRAETLTSPPIQVSAHSAFAAVMAIGARILADGVPTTPAAPTALPTTPERKERDPVEFTHESNYGEDYVVVRDIEIVALTAKAALLYVHDHQWQTGENTAWVPLACIEPLYDFPEKKGEKHLTLAIKKKFAVREGLVSDEYDGD